MELNESTVIYNDRSYELPKVEDHFPRVFATYHHVELPKVEDHFPRVFGTYHHALVIVVTYLLMAKVFGPRWMQKRKPFELRGVIMAYNLLQVVTNVYMLYTNGSSWGSGVLSAWKYVCNPVGETIGFTLHNEYLLLKMYYYYHLSKILDLMDTVFFILRKKQSQVTVLHVFHHSTMVVNSWMSLVVMREQIIALFGCLNITVHIFMYSYYFLAAFGSKIQKYLWWKKHLTRLQLLQLVIMLGLLAKMKLDNCKCSEWFWLYWTLNITAYFGLFLNFYFSSYRKKKARTKIVKP